MKQSVSILGCGWLGIPLAIHLLKNGSKLKGSTTSINKLEILSSMNIEPYLINLDTIEASLDLDKFLDSEILIVAVSSRNVNWFQNLIASIEKSSIQKVVFISSTSVYSNSASPITEESEVISSPLVEIEKLFQNNSKFNTTVIRFGGLIGYDRKPGNFHSVGKKIDNPDGFVNMIHRDDCIQIIEQIITKNIWGEVLNACADTHPIRRDFYSKAAIILGRITPEFNENGITQTKVISSSKLKKLLFFDFRFPNLLEIL